MISRKTCETKTFENAPPVAAARQHYLKEHLRGHDQREDGPAGAVQRRDLEERKREHDIGEDGPGPRKAAT